MSSPAVVLDTNVFVAAGFNRSSASAWLVAAVADGRLRLVWDEATRAETRAVVERIPPLRWDRFAPLFRPAYRHAGATDPSAYPQVTDPGDRKFAALAAAADAVLVSNDDHLLAVRASMKVPVLTPGAARRRFADAAAGSA